MKPVQELLQSDVISQIVGTMIAVPLSKIIDPPRKNHSVLSPHKYMVLKQDIKKHCIEPCIDFALAVRPLENGMYEIIDGRHRCQIVRELKWKTVNCIPYFITEKAARKLSIRRNVQHGEFTDVLTDEIAALLKDGDSIDDLVLELAFTEKELLDLAAAASLPDDLLKGIDSEEESTASKIDGGFSGLYEFKVQLSKVEREIVNKSIDLVMDKRKASHPGEAISFICKKFFKKFGGTEK